MPLNPFYPYSSSGRPPLNRPNPSTLCSRRYWGWSSHLCFPARHRAQESQSACVFLCLVRYPIPRARREATDSLIAGPWARSWGCRDEADTLLSCSPVGQSQEAPQRVRLTWRRPRVATSQTLRERREGRGLARRRGHLGWIWAPPSR